MKKNRFLWFFVIFALICGGMAYYINNRDTSQSEKVTVKEYEVTRQTIKYELTGAGELQSCQSENMQLSSSKKYKLCCVEKQDTVKKGEPLVQYSDGTYLNAPYDCVVKDMSLPKSGSKANASNYISIVSTESLILSIKISEADIDQVSVGQQASIFPNKDDSIVYLGEISYISPVGSRSNGYNTFEAEIEFVNDNLKVGMSATCSILLKQSENVLVVPIEAVFEKDSLLFVLVKTDIATEEREVTIGLSDASLVEIISGLQEGEKVIYEVQ